MTDHLATDLRAFLAEHERCGELDSGVTEREPVRVWVTCTCGAKMERAADPENRRRGIWLGVPQPEC